jgi:phosphohistidine phosphatase SixA
MPLPEYLYLVRHGSYDERGDKHLTELGKEQSIRAGEELHAEGFDGSSLLMTSTTDRTMETARIIAEVLRLENEIIYSDKLAAMDNAEGLIRFNLAEVVIELAQSQSAALNFDSKLAIVGHAPMIYKELGVDLDVLDEGSVHKMKT